MTIDELAKKIRAAAREDDCDCAEAVIVMGGERHILNVEGANTFEPDVSLYDEVGEHVGGTAYGDLVTLEDVLREMLQNPFKLNGFLSLD